VARSLDPDFNMWKASEPVVSRWVAENLGPCAIVQDAGEGLQALLALLRQGPLHRKHAEQLSQAMARWSEEGMRLDEDTIRAIGKAEARHSRLGHIALWVIAATLIWLAIAMM